MYTEAVILLPAVAIPSKVAPSKMRLQEAVNIIPLATAFETPIQNLSGSGKKKKGTTPRPVLMAVIQP